MTIEEAIDFVQEKLRTENKSKDTDLIINKRSITETPTHWIIPFQSKRYLESGDAWFIEYGIKPLAVDKKTGKVDPAINTSWEMKGGKRIFAFPPSVYSGCFDLLDDTSNPTTLLTKKEGGTNRGLECVQVLNDDLWKRFCR